jgi:hypothetical protein
VVTLEEEGRRDVLGKGYFEGELEVALGDLVVLEIEHVPGLLKDPLSIFNLVSLLPIASDALGHLFPFDFQY